MNPSLKTLGQLRRDVFAKDAEWRGGKPRAFNFAIGDAVYYGYSPLRWTIEHLLEDGTAWLAHPLAGYATVKVADLRYYWNGGQVTAGAASVAERLVPRMEPVERPAPDIKPRERRRLHDQPRSRAQEEQDMSDEHSGLPVPGYTPQSEANVDLGRESKEIEELVLRQIDLLEAENHRWRGTSRKPPFDPRWLAIARTQIEQGFMALNRAIFKPKRAPLQDDDPDPAPMVADERTDT